MGTSDDAARPALPALTPSRAHQLAAGWSDGGLWDDIQWLAALYWAAADPDERTIRWHHLVLAVGNFKRQAGRRLRPTELRHLPSPHGSPRPELTTSADVTVRRDDPNTWSQLSDSLKGAGVATTTTLLAALWADDHFVFDWRVRSTANALRIAAGRDPCTSVRRNRDGGPLIDIDMDDYTTVRGWLLTVDCPLVEAERALYRLSQKVPTVRGRTWDEYAHAVTDMLDQLVPE